MGNNSKPMIFDIIAHFYVNANDQSPRYRVPLGVVVTDDHDHFKRHGFSDLQNSDGFCDYTKEIQESELEQWTDGSFDPSEILEVLEAYEYERLELCAYELEHMEDEGLPHRGLTIGRTYVTITDDSSRAFVLFEEGNDSFSIPLYRLLDYFGILTKFELIDHLRTFGNERQISFSQLKETFKHLN